MFIGFNTFFNISIRSNFNENVLWYFVELLNNNNKSILLFLSMLIFIIIVHVNNYNYTRNIFIVVLLFLLFEYKYHIYLNSSYLLIDYTANTSLINGVVLIHPLLIYLTYSVFVTFIFFYSNNSLLFNKVLYNIKCYKYKLFIFSFVALVLGG